MRVRCKCDMHVSRATDINGAAHKRCCLFVAAINARGFPDDTVVPRDVIKRMCSLHDDRDPRISIVKQERLFLAAARETSRRALNCRSLVKRATEMIRRGYLPCPGPCPDTKVSFPFALARKRTPLRNDRFKRKQNALRASACRRTGE